ncbi:MAG: GNAT family N-acetyltransferase [Oscillospiraceae bacterium]|nr:GNAT family N-acetyltransferase [Oscillospiraceae bacterium]
MELVLPALMHKQAAMDYRQEHFDCGETEMHGDGGLDRANTYVGWLEKIRSDMTRPFSEELVPATVYFGMSCGKIVGMLQIRHKLNERLLKTYGHIGYGVRPSERRKGYATQMLAAALVICRDEMGIEKVLISCDKKNIGSAKTILNNGGALHREFVDVDGSTVQQYWIELAR